MDFQKQALIRELQQKEHYWTSVLADTARSMSELETLSGFLRPTECNVMATASQRFLV
jgi:hypothetical protein